MAGSDYIKCAECSERLIYDGGREIREFFLQSDNTEGVTCDHCVSKLKKKIETLKKHDRRKH